MTAVDAENLNLPVTNVWRGTMTTNPKMTRADLQMLYHQTQERMRNSQITQLVDHIYNSVVAAATTSQTTLHQYEFSRNEFMEDNMPEIMEKLRDRFPGCKVSHKVFISSFIVVDWS